MDKRFVVGLVIVVMAIIIGIWWLYPTEEQASVDIPEPVGDDIQEPCIDTALSLYKDGSWEKASDAFLQFSGTIIIEFPDVARAAATAMINAGNINQLDALIGRVASAPIVNPHHHVLGLSELAHTLYVHNDLHRCSLVEERLRMVVTELVNYEPGDIMMRFHLIRLWAGYTANFPAWDMVYWLVQGMFDLFPVADLSEPLQSELYTHLAQAALERPDQRDRFAAKESLEKALSLYEGNAWPWYLSGLWEAEYGCKDRAQGYLERAYDIAPHIDEIKVAYEIGVADRRDIAFTPIVELKASSYDMCSRGRIVVAAEDTDVIIYDIDRQREQRVDELSIVAQPSLCPQGLYLAYLVGVSGGAEETYQQLVIRDITDQSVLLRIDSQFDYLYGVAWMSESVVTVWGQPADGDAGIYAIDIYNEATELVWGKDMVWSDDKVDWDWSDDGLFAVLDRQGEGYLQSNARIWFSDNDDAWLAIEYVDLIQWNPGSVQWSSAGELVGLWSADSWAGSPVKIITVTEDGWEFMTGGRSMESSPTWSPDGTSLAYFTNPIGSHDWQLVLTDRSRTWEARFQAQWRWWQAPVWANDRMVVGLVPDRVIVYQLPSY